MSNYYKLNPNRTFLCVFHQRNWEANRKLKVIWKGEALVHYNIQAYLGVILDRSLTYKHHFERTSKKINTCNGLLWKLTNSKWEVYVQVGIEPPFIRKLIATSLEIHKHQWPKASYVWTDGFYLPIKID